MSHVNVSLALVLLILLPIIAIAAPVRADIGSWQVWTDKSSYNIGEAVTIHVQPTPAFGVEVWVIIWKPDGSQTRADLGVGQNSITFQDTSVPGQYRAELWGQVVAPNTTPELGASCNFAVVGGPAPSKDVKFRGTVIWMSPDGIDYQVRIEEIVEDSSGVLRVGPTASIDMLDTSLIVNGPIQVGDKVEVYGELYNANPSGPGVSVVHYGHYIMKIGPTCGEGDVRVLETCPDGSWSHRLVCRNNAWQDENRSCPTCNEGDVQVLETCPDGSWSHRLVCRNNAWQDEHRPCPPTPPNYCLMVTGEEKTLVAPTEAEGYVFLAWIVDGQLASMSASIDLKMDRNHDVIVGYVEPSSLNPYAQDIKDAVTQSQIEAVAKQISSESSKGSQQAEPTMPGELFANSLQDIVDLLEALGVKIPINKVPVVGFIVDTATIVGDVEECRKGQCNINETLSELDKVTGGAVIGIAETAICAALGVPTAGVGAVACVVCAWAFAQIPVPGTNMHMDEYIGSKVNEYFKLTREHPTCVRVVCLLFPEICLLAPILCAQLGSAAALLVQDSSGRRTGAALENGIWVTYSEIPNAWYSGIGSHPQYVTISDPDMGAYKFVITGKEAGSFQLAVSSIIKESAVASQDYSGAVGQGESQTLSAQVTSGGIQELKGASWWEAYQPWVVYGVVAIVVASIVLLYASRRKKRPSGRLGPPIVVDIRSDFDKPRVKSIQETGKKPRVLKVEEE